MRWGDDSRGQTREDGMRANDAEKPAASKVVLVAALVLTGLAGLLLFFAVSDTGHRSAQALDASTGQEVILGQSVRGAPLVLTRFGSGSHRLLVIGGIHGDEFGTAVAEQLVDALRTDPHLLPTDTLVDVIETMNPDGLAAYTRGNADKVDLNRNMPSANWAATLDPRDSSATRGLSGGTRPGSEPETQAFIAALKNDYGVVVSLHSNGGLVDFDGPGAEALAGRLATMSGLPLGHLPYQPYIHGSMGGYLAAIGMPLITVELTSPVLTQGLRTGMLSLP